MFAVRPSKCTGTTLIRRSVVRQPQAHISTVEHTPSRGRSRAEHSQDALPPARRTFFVRPWDGVPSMAHGFALMRALELKYGKLRDIRFGRDFEVNEVYQPNIFANFEDDRDFDQLPSQDLDIKLEVPEVPNPQPENISLVELQGLLLPFDKSDSSRDPWRQVPTESGGKRQMKTIDVKIGRSNNSLGMSLTSFLSEPEPRPSAETLKRIGSSFVQWGGFYRPPPPPSVRELVPGEEESDFLQMEPPVYQAPANQLHMAAAKRRWAFTVQPHRELTEQNVDTLQARPPTEDGALEDEIVLEQQSPEEEVEEGEAVSVEDVALSWRTNKTVTMESPEEPAKVEEVKERESAPTTSRSSKRDKLLALARASAAKSKPHRSQIRQETEEQDRLAALAHEHIHTPLPEEVIPQDPEVERKALAAEQEKQKADKAEAKATILGRLQRLWGGL